MSIGNIALWRILAQLQRADVSRDTPSVARGNLRRVVWHDAIAIRIDVEQIPDGDFAQTVNVKRRRTPEPARGNEAIAVANASVTGRAVDVVTLASSFKNINGHRERHVVARIVADFPSVKVSVFAQIAAGNRAVDRHSRGATVREEIALRQGPVVGLQVHVEAASRGPGNQRQQRGQNSSEVERGTHG